MKPIPINYIEERIKSLYDCLNDNEVPLQKKLRTRYGASQELIQCLNLSIIGKKIARSGNEILE